MDVSVKVVGGKTPSLDLRATIGSVREAADLINIIVANAEAIWDEEIVFGEEAAAVRDAEAQRRVPLLAAE